MTRKYTVYVLRSGGASTPLNNKPCLFFPLLSSPPLPFPPCPSHFLRRHRHSLLSIIHITYERGEGVFVPRLRKKKAVGGIASRAHRPYCELTNTVNSLGRYAEPRRAAPRRLSAHRSTRTLNSLEPEPGYTHIIHHYN